METLTLYNGVEIPANGFGVYQVRKEDCKKSVLAALKAGPILFQRGASRGSIGRNRCAKKGNLPDHQGVGGALRLRGGKSVCTGIHAQTAHGLP